MSKKNIIIAVFILSLFSTIISPKFSLAEKTASICPPKKISFGLYENGYIYDCKKKDGVDKDIALELSKRSGCEFEFRTSTRARIWIDLENGKLMMSGSGIQNKDRDSFAWFIRCMGQKNYVIINKGLKIKSKNEYINTNTRLKWGVINFYKHGLMADRFINELKKQKRIEYLNNTDDLFKMLSLGRINGFFAPPPVYPKYLKIYNLNNKVRIEDWFPEDKTIPHGLIFSKKFFNSNQMKKWKNIVLEMKKDGTLKKIYEKYLGYDGAVRMMNYHETMQNFENLN